MKKISFPERCPAAPRNGLYRLALRITLNYAEAGMWYGKRWYKVWNRRDHWDELESIEAFCLTICRNIAIAKTKKAENQNRSLMDEHDAPDHSYLSNPEEQAMQQDRISLIRRLIDTLPEKQRSCMQLRDFEGKELQRK